MLFLIPVLEIKNDLQNSCKETLINIYGWTGTVSVVIAYGLTSFDSEEYLLIDILNLWGSLSIGYTCYRARVWQALVCEIIWFSIGIYSLIKNILNHGEDDCH